MLSPTACISCILQARCKYSDVMVAIKVYKLKEQGDIQRMQLYREIKLHSKLQHNNVIQYLACFLVSALCHGVRVANACTSISFVLVRRVITCAFVNKVRNASCILPWLLVASAEGIMVAIPSTNESPASYPSHACRKITVSS